MRATAGVRRFAPDAVAGGAAAAVAAGVVLAPWWRPGALLVRDLVAVGRPAWSLALLDAADRLPRDVPGEALTALAGQVVPGDLVVRLVIAAALVVLGAGAGRLVDHGRWPAAVAGLVVVWNPYVLARLHQGQWLVVVALAGVPYVVAHVIADDRLRLARTLVLAAFTGFLAPLVVGPTLLAVGVATRRWRALASGLAVLTAASLPWLVVTGPIVADPDGVRAFAPSADLPLGVVPSLLSGGGYFNTAVASPWRSVGVVAVLALLLAGLATWGAVRWAGGAADATTRRGRTGLVVVGLGAVALASITTTTVGQAVLVEVGEVVPPVAALRDSQRLVAPWALVLAVGAGAAAHWLGRRSGELPAVGIAVALLAVVALPDPVIGPRLPQPSTVPDSWSRAAEEIEAAPAPVLLVPHGQTQRYAFTGDRPVAVPLRRMVTVPVLADTRLVVGTPDGDLVVDDRPGGEAGRALAAAWPDVDAGDLAAQDIGWVAVTDPDRFGARPPGTTPVVNGATLQLVRVDGVPDAVPGGRTPSVPVLVVDLLVAAGAAAVLALTAVRRANSAHVARSRRTDGG